MRKSPLLLSAAHPPSSDSHCSFFSQIHPYAGVLWPSWSFTLLSCHKWSLRLYPFLAYSVPPGHPARISTVGIHSGLPGGNGRTIDRSALSGSPVIKEGPHPVRRRRSGPKERSIFAPPSPSFGSRGQVGASLRFSSPGAASGRRRSLASSRRPGSLHVRRSDRSHTGRTGRSPLRPLGCWRCAGSLRTPQRAMGCYSTR